jgi:hypothetical protein
MRYVVSPSLVALAVTFLAGAVAHAQENPSKASEPATTAQAAQPTDVPSVDEMNPPVGQPSGPAEKPAEKPAQPDAATLAAAAMVKGTINSEGKICYRDKPLGSRMYKEVCKTREEVEATAAAAQDAMRVMRNTAGSEKGN